MRRVSATEPIRTDAVMQAQGIKAYLKCTHVKCSVRPSGVLICGGLREQGGGAVATSFGQNLLRQLEHEMGQGL